MTTTHLTTPIFAILTFTLCVCRAQATLDLKDNDVVCSSAIHLINNLRLYEWIKNKAENITNTEWNLNGNESRYLPMVCQAAAVYALGSNSADLHDLEDSAAGRVVGKACKWLYNTTEPNIPKCKEHVYYYCFHNNTESWVRFRNDFNPVFNCNS